MTGNSEHEARPGVLYTLDHIVTLTGVSRRDIIIYCKSGLLSPLGDLESEQVSFDDEAVYRIRRIEHLRTDQGINLAGIRIIFELLNQVRRLEEEMRFLRS